MPKVTRHGQPSWRAIAREKKRAYRRRVGLCRLLMVVGFICGPLVAIIGSLRYREATRLHVEGAITEGRVWRAQRLPMGNWIAGCRLVVDYGPHGAAILRRTFLGVPAQVYEQAIEERTVPVRYLPRRPGVSILGEHARANPHPISIGFSAFGVSFAIWLDRRRRTRWIRNGLFGHA